MFVGHLVSGVAVGTLAGTASLIVGSSAWAALGVYVLGGNVGFALSVTAVLLRPQEVNSPRTTFDNWATPAK